MRLYEVATNEGGSIEKLAAYIKANAAQYLEESKSGVFEVFRGLTNRSYPKHNDVLKDIAPPAQEVFFGPGTKENRRPLDTSAIRHAAFNGVLAAVGSVANRSNSLFASGSRMQASGYGTLYVVVPLGKFHYTWSTRYRDWYKDFTTQELRSYMLPEAAKATLGMESWDLTRMQDSLMQAPARIKEMEAMLQNPASYDKIALSRVIQVDTGWHYAADKDKEIMLYAPAGVIYIHPQFYKAFLLDYLK
jgi:hypothetical protein